MFKKPMKDYGALLSGIKERIRHAQYEALKAVNKEMVALYWDIGKMITERQRGQTWGKSVVERLAKDLQSEFPGIKGFSAQNLWYMRQFYKIYNGNKKLQPLVGEISWAKHLQIMSKCDNDYEREFYIRMVKKFSWTKNVLALNIEAGTYEKYLNNQTNFKEAVPGKIASQAKLAVKDEYTFDFLELGEEHGEKELENALIAKINRFLSEMGGVFTFAGSQFRLEIGGKEYFIDILLYHRHLKCLVAIELKIGEFLPEYVGKMQFYLAALDDLVKRKDENPSIGIIICREKNRTIVEYALKESKKPIGVSSYKLSRAVPRELKKELPTPRQMALLLDVK